MHNATEWLYPASMLALGCLRLRTHSIQFRMLAVVDESAPVFAAVSVGATCESCPIKSSHVASIEPRVRALVGADNVFVHDYFDWFHNQFSVQYGD